LIKISNQKNRDQIREKNEIKWLEMKL
jgi:hypothetical protein